MATRKRAGNAYSKNEYVYGSAVRKLQAVPKREPERPKKSRSVSSRTLKNRRRAAKMSIQYVIFLSAATIAMLAICIGYLQLRSEVDNRAKRINAMENQLKDAKAENDANYNRIIKSVNLEEIRRIAIEELHMVYADESQIIFYEAEESDYVRQYEDIPEGEKDSLGKYLQK